MYIRFISPTWAAEARTHAGFFAMTYNARYDRRTPLWMREELGRELQWFNAHLGIPARLSKETGRGRRNGVCWFRDGASQHISHARYICWILRELGRTTTELRTRRPGTLIWSDDNQVVALAERVACHKICA